MCDHPKGLVFLTSSFDMVRYVLAVLLEARPEFAVDVNIFHSRDPEFNAQDALEKSAPPGNLVS